MRITTLLLRVAIVSAIFWTALTMVALAQSVNLHGEVFAVYRSDDGQEELRELQDGLVAPGDTLEFQFTYSNELDEAVESAVVVGPIPEYTVYQGGTAEEGTPSEFQVYVPEIAEWTSPPVFRKKTQEDGSVERQEIPPSEYSSLRWVFLDQFPSGEEAIFTYRVKVK